jgi:hypothetical protein
MSSSGFASDPLRRVGDPGREKWAQFLAAAMTAGYLTQDEYQERLDKVLAARTLGDIDPYVTDLNWKPWNEAWNALRQKGIHPGTDILPEVPARPADPEKPFPVLWVCYVVLLHALVITGWLLYAVK